MAAPNPVEYALATAVASVGIGSVGFVFWPSEAISGPTSALSMDSHAEPASDLSDTVVKFLPYIALSQLVIMMVVIGNHFRKPSVKNENSEPSLKNRDLSSSLQSTISSPSTIKDMIRAIDSNDGQGWQAIAESLFNKYDKDKSGSLEKAEYKAVLEDLASYVVGEYDAKFADTNMVYSKADIKNKMRWDFDTDFDNIISREEFLKNIKVAVDQID